MSGPSASDVTRLLHAWRGGDESVLARLIPLVYGEPPPLTASQPLTPPAFDHLVRTCLAKDPDARWDTAHDVADELRWIRQNDSRVGLGAAPSARKRFPRKKRWVWAGVAAAAVIALAAGAYAWHARNRPILTDRDVILLTDFVNTTGDPVFDGALKEVVRSLEPWTSIYTFNVAAYTTLLGRLAEAKTLWEAYGRQWDDQHHYWLYRIALLQGDAAEAERQLEWAKGKPQEATFMTSLRQPQEAQAGQLSRARAGGHRAPRRVEALRPRRGHEPLPEGTGVSAAEGGARPARLVPGDHRPAADRTVLDRPSEGAARQSPRGRDGRRSCDQQDGLSGLPRLVEGRRTGPPGPSFSQGGVRATGIAASATGPLIVITGEDPAEVIRFGRAVCAGGGHGGG